MSFMSRRVLVFLRVSSENQDINNQMFEVSSYLWKRGIQHPQYISMVGSAYRSPHPIMKNAIDSFISSPETLRPKEVVFAAVDRLSRNVDAGVEMIKTLRGLNIDVSFARTPNLNIYTEEGWDEFLELLKAAEVEGNNISTRSRLGWQRKRQFDEEQRLLQQQTGIPPAKRVPSPPTSSTPMPYHFMTLSPEQRNAYYRDNLYLIYLFGNDNATVGDILKQIKKMHKKYAPQLLEESYGIKTGNQRWDSNQVFVGNDEDFANLMNVYHLGPSGPGAYDRWSADTINAVFERVLPQVSPSFSSSELYSRKEFLERVESFELGAHVPPPPENLMME